MITLRLSLQTAAHFFCALSAAADDRQTVAAADDQETITATIVATSSNPISFRSHRNSE
jgi:hypothetical protein